jgi:hypothetical protein
MSRAPFSKPDVNDVVSSSPVFRIHPSLNHWSRGRLPKARGKRLFGLVVIALLLLGLQLTACGNAATPPIGSASPTSNSTSLPNTPSTTSAAGTTFGSTPTSGPTNGPTSGLNTPTSGLTTTPTTGSTTTPTAMPTITPTIRSTITPTAVPTPDPSSFTITVQGGTYCYSGTFGQSDVNILDFPSPLQINYGGSANPAPGPINWTVSALPQAGASCSDPCPSTNLSSNWLSFNPPSDKLSYNSTPLETVTLQVSHAASMPVGVYCTKFQFSVNPDQNFNPDKNYAYAELTINPATPTLTPPPPTPTPTPPPPTPTPTPPPPTPTPTPPPPTPTPTPPPPTPTPTPGTSNIHTMRGKIVILVT